MPKKLRGLFLNTEKAICSIYESGKMSYDCLAGSNHYSLDYVELTAKNKKIELGYDFYIFNYHWVQMGWLDTKLIKLLPGFKATIVLEMSQNAPFDCVSCDDFDAYLVLDPTCKHFLSNVYSFPRPLESCEIPVSAFEVPDTPIIGTFGLSFADKGFDEVIKAANQEFDAAIVRINVPKSSYVTAQVIDDFSAMVTDFGLKKDIKIELSEHYFNKEELIRWCAQNTLNVFLYNRRIGNGLSATTDQAIASRRPLAVSTNPTFRHIHTYIKPYPYLSLKEAIDTTAPLVKKIQEDWSPRNFMLKFEALLQENAIKPREAVSNNETMVLPKRNLFKKGVRTLFNREGFKALLPPLALKARKRLRSARVVNNTCALKPFVHQVLQSSSQFQEDLLIDLLLGVKNEGTYVDIGANDPFFHSNTQRFYLRGWRGINIEPGASAFEKIAKHRPLDINLNLAISDKVGRLTFYQVGNDSSLSTLDLSTAEKMAETYKSELTATTVDVLEISQVLDSYLAGRHIDFMSVDAEGHDLAVLKSNDWDKYRPTLVMVESNISAEKIIKFMDQQYYLYVYSNHVNAIFIDKTTKDSCILKNIFWHH